MTLTIKKNPLFCMLDTETIYNKKRVYEIAAVIFDSESCQVIAKKSWFIRDTLESAIFCYIKLNKYPLFWPSRLNPLTLLKQSVTWEQAKAEFLAMLECNGVQSLIAHNINFDVSAIYSTDSFYTGDNNAFLSKYQKLELSGYFIHGLPLMAAYNVPFKVKSGCMTFKADYLAPCLLGATQNHDALGDCHNQIALYKLTRGKYQNQGTIYANMLKHHAVKHDDNKRLGNSSLD